MEQQSETPSSRAKQPGQKRFPSLSLNASFDGIISLGVILLIIGVAFLRGWNIAWWYFVLTILSYIVFLFFRAHLEDVFLTKSLFSSSEDKRNTTVTIGPFRISRAHKVQLWMSAHLALILLVVGLWLHPSNLLVQVGIFVGAVIAGAGIPFLVPRLRNLKPRLLKFSTPPVAGHLVVFNSSSSLLAPGTEFNLTRRTTIGRGPANTIQIQDESISTEHTRMLFRKGIWYVQDAGSVNGTYVNSQPAHDPLEAHWGDFIQIGYEPRYIRFKLLSGGASFPVPAQSMVSAGQAQSAAASVAPSGPVRASYQYQGYGGYGERENVKAVSVSSASLTIRLPEGKQVTYRIEKAVVSIGRQLDNDIIVEDKRAARHHAQIKYQSDGQFVLFHLGSTNGITINTTPHLRAGPQRGEGPPKRGPHTLLLRLWKRESINTTPQRGPHTLRNGDRFTIASYDLLFERR